MARIPAPAEERSPFLTAFGQTVRRYRKEKGFSQEAFADVCGIDRSYMGGVERGERNIALVNVEKIIRALGMQPSEFFTGLDKPDETHVNGN
ncbi:helix-turn-helix domain-containing protein [Ralstonia pseudosolanacearum]|uniref:helix-turn-helix domain-containing protein n=1 Tax=Ralstonia pseudosolanacearum TaxID=1310165 RepID=UPI0005C3D568|nr:helix-turn-helix transcriptional regulator [Ralstonia pseudosolanacearum]AST29039.1 transcriptional regulator [Ralstonia pseudosolanacearum]MCQ4681614.1 helix-turn-helix domain-containing protein [Ralstonia pseudosolanacearum]MDC6286389.1 helix-turn-helix transcriptional regulator [Ralstonia pseudosolanacearum]